VSHPPAAKPVARTPIGYRTANGALTHAPLVDVEIGRRRLSFVLDTGSEVHLVTSELAAELGLEGTPGEEGIDHSGASLASWDVGEVSVEIGGAALTLRGVVAIPAPPPFTEQGIAGILSPQHLHASATAVVDMARGELLLVDATDAQVRALLAKRVEPRQLLTLDRVPGFAGIVVRASIDGDDEIDAMLNTGGRGTELSRAVLPDAQAGLAVRIGGGLSGADVMGAEVGPIEIHIGGRVIRVDRLSLRERMHDPQALIGMDLLEGSVLACAADRSRPVFWSLPG